MIKTFLIRKAYNFMLYKLYRCKVIIGRNLITDLSQNTMLTLNKNISELTENLLNNKGPDNLESYLKLFKQIETIEGMIDEVENSWEKREEIINSENIKKEIEIIEKTLEIMSIVEKTIKRPERKHFFAEESLQKLTNLLIRYRNVVNDAIESNEIVKEIAEIRSKPLDSTKIIKAKEIWLSLKGLKKKAQ